MRRLASLILLDSCLCFTVAAQDSIQNAFGSFQDIVTEIISRTDEASGTDELADMLYDLTSNPVLLNTATDEELGRLFWLNDFQLKNLRHYLQTYTSISSIYELIYIPGFAADDVMLLAPFIKLVPMKKPTINDKSTVSGLNADIHQRVLMRTYLIPETQQGFHTPEKPTTTNHFLGKPNSYYYRYGLQYKKRLFAGFTAEKDAGEEFFTGSNKQGFDFYSGYIRFNQYKSIKTLLLGDYHVKFGQGLAVWSGFNMGKSMPGMGVMQRSNGISQYQSSDENNFYRGAAATLSLTPVEVTLWLSTNRVDANRNTNDTLSGGTDEFTAQQITGIHATPEEIADEDAIRTNVAGTNVSLVTPNLCTGVTAVFYHYSAVINPEAEPYNEYYFRGKANYNLSFDYRYRTRSLVLFGEEATTRNGSLALLNGLQTYVNARLSFSLVHRYYQRNYQAMLGNAFGENSRNSNESGLFAGFESSPFSSIRFSAFIDAFRFPWLTYSADMPTTGREVWMQLVTIPSPALQISVQYRYKQKEENYRDSMSVSNKLATESVHRVRYQISYKASKSITLRTKLEQVRYEKEFSGRSSGYYLGEDMILKPGRIPVTFYLHYALFDTDDYNARIYAGESDLLYTFHTPVLYEEGYRTFVMVKYSPAKTVSIWLKYGITQYLHRETVGTGLYAVNGNHLSQVKAQMLISF